MGPMHFLLQTLLLLPLVLLPGHVYGETKDIAEAPSRLVGEAIPGNSTDTTWNVTGPTGSRLHLNCTDLTLLKSADCSEGFLSIFENGQEETICKGGPTVYSRESEGNRLTVRIKTEPSTIGGRVSCGISLMKGSAQSAETDTADYADVNVQNDPKTPDPYGGTDKRDSGGPLVIWDQDINLIVQVGLITDKFDCVNWVVPRLNTEILPHVDWIERKVREYVPNPNRPLERLACKKYHRFL